MEFAWSGTRYVGVSHMTGLAASTNGLTWTTQYPVAGGFTIRSVTWSGHQFVACGDSGAILSSPDGLRWVRHPKSKAPQTDLSLNDIHWTGKDFITVGEAGAILSSSQDPVTVRPRSKPQPGIAWAWVGNQLEVSLPAAWVGKKVRVTAYSPTGRVVRRKTMPGQRVLSLPWSLDSTANLRFQMERMD